MDQKQDRISILAQPKINHQVIYCRPTVYWVDKIPPEPPHFTVPVLTPRQEELSQLKKVNAEYRGDRLSPVLPITPAALRAEASPRLKELAQPRCSTNDWYRPRSLMVSRGALTATPTPRILALAEPRRLPPPPQKPPRKILRGPIPAVERYAELSKPRIYTFDAQNPYKISKAALQYVASPRVLEISRPTRKRSKVTRVA